MILLKNKDKKANIKIGNNIEIKDGNDFPFDLTLYGKSTQATRSGKNLFNKYGDFTYGSTNNKTSLQSDGTILSTSNFANRRSSGLLIGNIKSNTDYTISGILVSADGTNTANNAVIQVLTTSNTLIKDFYMKTSATKPYNFSFTFNSGENTSFWISLNGWNSTKEGTTNTVFDNIQLEEGTVATDYEPYGVMPSPDYPSPIESVGRKNIIKSLSSKWSSGINYNLDNSLIKKTMTFSCIIDTSITSANLYIIPATGVSAISLGTINFTANQRATKTFNLTDEQIQVIKSNQGGIFQIYKSSAFESANITDAQLEKGTVASDYVPYEHTEISATVTGKNLLENKTKNSGISRGITFTLNGDGSYTLNGTNDGTGNATVFLSSSSNPTTLKAGTYYTIPTPNGVHITGAKIGGGYFQFASSSTSQFTLNEDIQAQIYIQVPNEITTTYNNIKVYPMISTTPITQTDYEQYKSNSLTIDLQGNELCSLPNGTKDEVNITNGEALLTKRIGKVVLDGSESWSVINAYNRDYFYVNISGILVSNNNDNPSLLYSNYYKSYTATDLIVSGVSNYGICRRTNYSQVLFRNIDATSLANFKTWLSTHNTEVLYELAEPETINLGTVEMPHTYEGVSNITNSADTEMVVKYYKKFEFDKILRSGYNIDEQEYEIAKKQMANGKRKKILSSYVDCIIKIDLGLLDNKTYQEYKEQLEDGEYEYWSYKYNQYKKANFILTKPSITTEYAYDDEIGIDDMEITLEKSSDVS